MSAVFFCSLSSSLFFFPHFLSWLSLLQTCCAPESDEVPQKALMKPRLKFHAFILECLELLCSIFRRREKREEYHSYWAYIIKVKKRSLHSRGNNPDAFTPHGADLFNWPISSYVPTINEGGDYAYVPFYSLALVSGSRGLGLCQKHLLWQDEF